MALQEKPDTRAKRPTLDSMLTDAALGSSGPRWLPGVAGAKAAAKLALAPQKTLKRAGGYGFELARIAAGRSEVAPAKGDKRFKDKAWQGNPAFKRLGQSYIATGQYVDGLISDAGLDWAEEQRLRFACENILDALAPTNFPATNPAVLKAWIDSGGGHVVQGTRQLIGDMAKAPRIPTMVDTTKFVVGEHLACTKGAVVFSTEVFELIQYAPLTEQVRETPLVVVPPMINKYYVTDLAPGRSMIEHALGQGQQVFAISWRNPGAEQADWSLETYVAAVLDALDAATHITGTERAQTIGLCAGGIVLSIAVAHLAAKGELNKVAGLTLGVCVLDNERAGTVSSFADRRAAALAVAESARKGYLSGRSLAGVFAWLRPTDLVWGYWVNNYLLGKRPPAFDILFWNADTTNMPAGLHRDFVGMSLDNTLVNAGELEVLGTPIDLGAITTDAYLVAGIADHISPWENCYRTTQLLGSEPRFVLSTSGHIAAMVNPPGNEKASFQTAKEHPADPEKFLAQASKQRGSWWEDWTEWLGERSGPEQAAPKALGKGRGRYSPQGDAPGTYVFQQV
ncbi:MAG: alpha/beta fold hydrolase [Solirubrobacterales bacterium]|nr:alpha/beta fold hydrolase [Solirubrobacterales bacterium]